MKRAYFPGGPRSGRFGDLGKRLSQESGTDVDR